VVNDGEGEVHVKLLRRLLFPLVGLLGAGVVVLPALAASSEAKIEVAENCNEPNWPCWAVPGPNQKPASVKIVPGGVVTFADNTSVAANIAWAGPAPTCSTSVPVSPMTAKTGWEGTCKFEAAGTYKFESASLWFEYTKYEIVVEAATTGTTTTGAGSGGSSTSGGTGTSTTSSGAGSPAAAGGQGQAKPPGSLLAGGVSSALTLGSAQHGQSMHGSIDVSQAAAGGRLEVELLARKASLASAGHSAQVEVGHVVRSLTRAGRATFAVALDAKARRALRVRRRLALSVKIVLSPAHGLPLTITRSLLLRD
jgi:hypothetical protein